MEKAITILIPYLDLVQRISVAEYCAHNRGEKIESWAYQWVKSDKQQS